jgi:hypothetical protein
VDLRLVVAHIRSYLGSRRLAASSDLVAGWRLRACPRHATIGLVLLDRRDEVTLAHFCGTGDAHRRGHRLQLAEQHPVQTASGPPALAC